jgi:hypothetical protein
MSTGFVADLWILRQRICHAALNSRNYACLFSILFRDLTAFSLH